MTREEALTKLLALGPLSRTDIEHITRWPPQEVGQALSELRARKALKSSSVDYGYPIFALAPRVPSPFAGAPA